MTNKSKCLNELCSLRTTDGLCAVDKLIPCIFQEGRQKTMMANDTSYTVTGSIIDDTPKTTDEESKEDKVENAIDFSIILVILSAAGAIGLATIYLIVKIIKEIIGV